MHYRMLGWPAIALLAAACGGNVQSGGTSSGGTSSGGTSSGGTSSGGTSSGGTSSGGTSSGGTGGGPPPTCSGFTDCCLKACNRLTNSLQCPGTPGPDCGCNGVPSSMPAGCINALADAYRCFLTTGPDAVKCDKNGNLALRCGYCETELHAVAQACSGSQPKCVY